MEVMNTAHMRQALLNRSAESEDEGEEDTWVFPLVQMKPLGIQVDEQVTQVRLKTKKVSMESFSRLQIMHQYSHSPCKLETATL